MTGRKPTTKVTVSMVTVNQEKPSLEQLMAANKGYFDAIEAELGKEEALKARERLRVEIEAELAEVQEGPVDIPIVHIGQVLFLVVGITIAATISALIVNRKAA